MIETITLILFLGIIVGLCFLKSTIFILCAILLMFFLLLYVHHHKLWTKGMKYPIGLARTSFLENFDNSTTDSTTDSTSDSTISSTTESNEKPKITAKKALLSLKELKEFADQQGIDKETIKDTIMAKPSNQLPIIKPSSSSSDSQTVSFGQTASLEPFASYMGKSNTQSLLGSPL